MLRSFLAAAVGAAVACLAPSALANGRFPASNQILFSTTNQNLYVVRSTFGIIMSPDSSAHWNWLCEDVLGLPPTSIEDPYLGLTSANAFVAGVSTGLYVSPDTGCTWNAIGGPLAGQLIKDLVVRADNPHIVDLVTSTYGATANVDGGPGYLQDLFESTNDGATWTKFGTPIDPTAIVTTLDAAPSDPNRLYASAYRGNGPMRTSSLFVSKDKGTTWTEHQTPLNPSTETSVYIGAVDPTNEDIVYLRSEGTSRLVVTRDGGQTYTSVAAIPDEMLGFALSSDGSKVYIGSVAAGLLVAPTASLVPQDAGTVGFTQTSTIQVQCLTTHGGQLFACSSEVSGFVAGVSSDDGKTFTPLLHLLSIDGPIACPQNESAALCSEFNTKYGEDYNPFVSLCNSLDACFDAGPPMPLMGACQCTGACTGTTYDASATCPEAGAPAGGNDAGTADAGAGGHPASKSSCGCSVVGGGGTLGGLAAGAGIAIALRVRRRRPAGASARAGRNVGPRR